MSKSYAYLTVSVGGVGRGGEKNPWNRLPRGSGWSTGRFPHLSRAAAESLAARLAMVSTLEEEGTTWELMFDDVQEAGTAD